MRQRRFKVELKLVAEEREAGWQPGLWSEGLEVT